MMDLVFNDFVSKNKELIPTLKKLNKNGVKYGLFSGSYVTLVTGYRETNDIDFLLSDDELDHIKSLFPDLQVEQKESTLLLYIDKERKLEFGCMGDFLVNSKRYPCRLTKLAQKRVRKVNFGNVRLNLLDPVDTLLAKAILNRGIEVKKHDISDAKKLLLAKKIERSYLLQRANEMHVDERVYSTLASIGVRI